MKSKSRKANANASSAIILAIIVLLLAIMALVLIVKTSSGFFEGSTGTIGALKDCSLCGESSDGFKSVSCNFVCRFVLG